MAAFTTACYRSSDRGHAVSRSALDFWAIVLAALPLALGACGTYPLYDGPERPRDIVAMLEAGKEYQFRVDGVDGEVFVWIDRPRSGLTLFTITGRFGNVGQLCGADSPTTPADRIH